MADVWYLDYANGWPSAGEVQSRGFAGTIRYVTSPALMQPPKPGNRKHITRAEYDQHRAAGLDVWLVYQGGTTDAESGFAGGRTNALRALEGCTQRDHPSGRQGPIGYAGPIFFCNDRPELPSIAAWREYLDGAASVLGVERTGAYGFGNAMDAARGHASWFWQAGRRSDLRAHVHFWQDNNFKPSVGGITCDRNLIVGDIRRNKMDLTPENLTAIADAVWNTHRKHLDPANELTLPMWVWAVGANMGAWADDFPPEERAALVSEVAAKVDAGTTVILTALSGGGVDPVAFAHAVADNLGPKVGRAVADELRARLDG